MEEQYRKLKSDYKVLLNKVEDILYHLPKNIFIHTITYILETPMIE